MKKLFAILLILSMLFALASCSQDKCDACVDDDGDGVCDECGNEIEPIFPGVNGDLQTPIVPIN